MRYLLLFREIFIMSLMIVVAFWLIGKIQEAGKWVKRLLYNIKYYLRKNRQLKGLIKFLKWTM